MKTAFASPAVKILSVCHYYAPHVGGIEVVAQKQAESLAGMGYESVVAAGLAGPTNERPENGVRVFRLKVRDFCDKRFGFPFPLLALQSIATMRRLVKNADLVHLHDIFYQTSWVAYGWARMYKKPVVLTQHVALVAHPSAIIMLTQRLVYWFVGRRIFRYASRIVVYNQNVHTFLLGQGVSADKITEMRNGVDVSSFTVATAQQKAALRRAYNLPTEAPIALFVGRLVPKKGFDILYAARDKSYELVFVGNGQIPDGWANAEHVHFVGPRSHKELVDFYQLSDLFVFPAEGEILTLVMQEAMACGLPIITTDDPAYKYYQLDRQGIAFVERTAEALHLKLLELIAAPATLQKMSQYSRRTAEILFDWSKNSKAMDSIYTETLQKPTVYVTTSWDDGHKLDLKLAEMLKRYHTKGTLYIAPKNREFSPADLLTAEQIVALGKDFEIGAHTVTHPRLPLVPIAEGRQEIIDSKKMLETMLGQPVTSFCYPRGEYTQEHVAAVREAGYSYARTVERFFYGKHLLNPFEARTSVNTYNHKLDLLQVVHFARYNPLTALRYWLNWDDLAITMYRRLAKKGGVLHLWGHSWELEDHGDWQRLERVLAFIADQPQTKYLTNRELLDVGNS